jgi:Flp pilus assembly protein protease CpaA
MKRYCYSPNVTLLCLLLLLTILVAIHDQRRREIPNWVTWPLLTVGVLAHFPGSLLVGFTSLLLLSAGLTSDGRGFGSGDIKLWLALLWLLPPGLSDGGAILIFFVLFVTSAIQILLTRLRPGASPIPIAQPAGWRAAVFMILIMALEWGRQSRA